MSTKTTFKRIALATVAAMGFGLLSVVPASAALTSTALTINAPATATASVAVGSAVSFDFTVTTTGTPTATDDAFTVAATIVKPTDSSAAVAAAGTATTTSAAFNLTKAANPTNWVIANSTNDLTLTAGASSAALTAAPLTTLTFIPDKPGVYTLTLTPTEATAATPTLTAASVTVYAGVSLDPLRANRAFPLQGTNITTGWSGVDTGLVTARITGFSTSSTVTYYVTATGGVINSYTERDAGGDTLSAFTNTNQTNLADGFFFTSASSQASDAVDVQLNPTDGGTTASITVTSFNATTGVSSTHVVATVSLGTAPAASAQYSTSIIAAGAAAAGASDAIGVSLARTAGVKAGNITVTVRDQNNNIMPTAGISATITGPGLLSIDDEDTTTSSAGTGRSVSLTTAEAAGNNGIANVTVYADGTAGVATITITSGTVTLATETVTFYGTVATLEATQYMSVAEASAAGRQLGYSGNAATFAGYDSLSSAGVFTQGTIPAVLITAKDSNGNVVPGLTITAVSSDASVIALATIVEGTGSTDFNGPGYYNASVTSAVAGVSGKSATVTFRTQLSTGAFISTTAVPFTLGKRAVDKITITFDSADYQAGGLMKVTQTAVDNLGNPVADGTYAGLYAATPVFSKPVVGAIANSTGDVRFSKGVRSSDVYAPVLAGPFTVRGTASNVTAAYALTVVEGGSSVGADAASQTAQAAADAAAEATDAANAATDAANAAAEAADAATAAAQDAADAVAALAASVSEMVNALKKQITSLTNLVIKIQKKVKA